MIDESFVGGEHKSPIWPQDGAVVPLFESPETAAAFVANAVGLTLEDLGFTSTAGSSNPGFNHAAAWFPGIPQTGLFYTDPTKGTYKLTEGATGIVRKVQSGDFTLEQLVTPPVRLQRPELFTLAPMTSSGAESASVDPGDEDAVLSVEQHLAGVAQFMNERGITAVLIQGTLDDGKPYEGVSLVGRELDELGDVLFSEGKIVIASVEEHERRLRTAGLIKRVVRPLQRAAHGVYEDGGDLLDEKFDVLPGFSE